NSAHVGDRLPLRRQRQFPARVVGHASRIIKLIRVEMGRGPYRVEAAQMAQGPELLEEGHVRNLPAQRVHDGETRPNHLLVVQIGDEVEQARARFLKMADQLRRSALRAGDLHRFTMSSRSGTRKSSIVPEDERSFDRSSGCGFAAWRT